jgi:hypothetical protein
MTTGVSWGVTLLAGKAVGAPFVGAVASSLVIAEVLMGTNRVVCHLSIGGELYTPLCALMCEADHTGEE